ncbi:MAG: alpha/beta hydrolase [Angelakisella sp.]|nr:alpha/beta hydrolase [Angelakisella sp.]
MTYEEMVERALRMRSRDLFGAVSSEEMEPYAQMQTELYIPVDDEKKVHVYQIAPQEVPPQCPLLINFHGGGFIKGRQNKDQLFCSKLATAFCCIVWDVDYSLAPEAPYPTAVKESYAVVQYAFASAHQLGIDPERIILMGHSAGGNLAATVCLKSAETMQFKPKGLIIEFCPLDLYTDPATKPRAEGDMPAEVAKTYNAFYCAPQIAQDPYVSPLFASDEQLSGFPDTLIMTAGNDSLCYEDEEFGLKLARAGVTVTCKRFQNSLHGFTINRTDDWQASMDLLLKFISAHLS